MQILDLRNPSHPCRRAGPAQVDAMRSVVCSGRHGQRSAQVVAFPVQRGDARVYKLGGGIAACSPLFDATLPLD